MKIFRLDEIYSFLNSKGYAEEAKKINSKKVEKRYKGDAAKYKRGDLKKNQKRICT